jgi:hypothetical protein
MNNTETRPVNFGLFKVTNNQRCPQCGGPMKEVERCKEGSITYVWFECARVNCDGQWLQSYPGLLPGRLEQTVA